MNFTNHIKNWWGLFLFMILAICSSGLFAGYYEIEGDCKTIGNLVDVYSSDNNELNKYYEKSKRVLLASVSNIVPVFSFEHIYALECKMHQDTDTDTESSAAKRGNGGLSLPPVPPSYK